jgi:hypothetical protein
MSADLAARLLTLLTLAEVWLKLRAYDDLAVAHADMVQLLDLSLPSIDMDFFRLLNQAKVWRLKEDAGNIQRCHAEMRALLGGVVA